MAINFNQVKQIELPTTVYEQVEYLYFNGTDNCIDSVPFFSKYVEGSITIEFEMLDVVGRQAICSDYVYLDGDNLIIRGFAEESGGAGTTIPNIQSNVKYSLTLEKGPVSVKISLYQNSTLVKEETLVVYSFVTFGYITLMAQKYDNTPTYWRYSHCKLYSYYGRIPYLNNSTGAIGITSSASDTKYDMRGTINEISRGSNVYPGIFPRDTVKMIKDSNDVVLWADPAVYPYRRLQYIQSTGTQAFDTNVRCGRNSYMKLIVEDTSNNASSQQQGRGAVSQAQRFAAGYSEGKYFFGFGSSWVTGSSASSGAHTIGMQGPDCNWLNGNGTTPSGTKQQGYYIDGTFTSDSSTFPGNITYYTVFLLGSRGDTSGSIQGPVACKMYYAEYGYTDNNNNRQYNRRYYPVQRKSDNKLGFYDTVNNTFLNELVSGSASNTLSAGPVADEYWDLTDPT